MGQARAISGELIASYDELMTGLREVLSGSDVDPLVRAWVWGLLIAHGGNVTVVHRRIQLIRKAAADVQDIRRMRETCVLAGFDEDALDYDYEDAA